MPLESVDSDSTLKYLSKSCIQTRDFGAERQPNKVAQPLKLLFGMAF